MSTDTLTPRRAVALACRVLADQGQGDMVWGHVALRDEEGRGLWMKPHLHGFEEVTERAVQLVSWNGDIIEGEGRRHSEFWIHCEILRARPDLHASVHTHSVHAVAFAASGEVLRPISHDGCLFVPPDINRFSVTGGLIRSPELGAALASELGDRNAMLMPNHGLVATGTTLGGAVMTTVLLDRACATQLLAGNVRSWSSDEEALAKRAEVWDQVQLDVGWDYLARRAIARLGAPW